MVVSFVCQKGVKSPATVSLVPKDLRLPLGGVHDIGVSLSYFQFNLVALRVVRSVGLLAHFGVIQR